jgi:HD superfamily phosphohydrolase
MPIAGHSSILENRWNSCYYSSFMASKTHEIRDPIHVFIRLSSEERELLDSRPFQRLRHIHQLALTYLVYPGATHRRFEHCLGVMELATRIYDVVTDPDNLKDSFVRSFVPAKSDHKWTYWRLVLRMAALCHDLGHLPFSHGAEEKLLPKGFKHENLSVAIILSDEMKELWERLKIDGKDVARLAVGPELYDDLDPWETILAEIIVGDAFGADRMDYLLRDSHHAGVSYGRFDHYRLVDTLRILRSEADPTERPTASLGIELGGLQAAESLIWARYFMYTQLYFHPVRRAYDILLMEFLEEWLPNGRFSTEVSEHLKLSDNEVLSAIHSAAREPTAKGHEAAKRILNRGHYRVLYQSNRTDKDQALDSALRIERAASQKFGADAVRADYIKQRSRGVDFPVEMRGGRIQSSLSESDTLGQVPTYSTDYVLIRPDKREAADLWLKGSRNEILKDQRELNL